MIDAFMKRIARSAGDICLQEAVTFEADEVEYKSVRDLVTPVDRKVEDYLRDEISKHYPDHSIIGEERGTSQRGSDSCWIIDPIDGTTSYVHGLPGYTVSIALQRAGELVAGVVYAPELDQMFLGAQGKGATLNSKPIRVSRRQPLVQSVLTTGFACIRDGQQKNNLEAFSRVMLRVRDIRRHGSAALDLAWVAAGKMDGYWERCLNIYDVAAGVVLVREAGGEVCDFMGGKEFPENGIVATNGHVHVELMELLADQ